MASQAGSMRLAAWAALRSHSHCIEGGEERGEGRRGRLALRLLQLWALGGGPPGWGEAPTPGSSSPLTLHIYLSASLNDRRTATLNTPYSKCSGICRCHQRSLALPRGQAQKPNARSQHQLCLELGPTATAIHTCHRKQLLF